MRLDSTAIVAGLLHDAVEDTTVTIEEIKAEFGEQVAHIVEGVTKISKIDFASSEEAQAENVRKMVLAMMDDIRVVLIKLADRLHNMRTLKFLSPERQHEDRARDAGDLRSHRPPSGHGQDPRRAGRPGVPVRRSHLLQAGQGGHRVAPQRGRGVSGRGAEASSGRSCKEAKIQAKVEARIKRLYSIWQKLQRQRISVDQIYDMLALRIITQSESDCYAVLGIIHNQWRPVPGRIKDFIAIPRNNFYKSLHTTVISEKGHAFEVQIRTEEMHKMAEEGIAAHWKYKDGPVSARDEQRLAWLRQVVEWQRDMKSSDEFLSTLKINLYPEEVYTFTPKGKIVILPHDATPIDFAYTVHTEVGHTCVGAKVNGRMAPLRYKLRSGDIVEIHDRARPPSQPRLAATGQIAARPPEDQALAERASARARHRNRPQADREGSAQISHRAEEPQRSRAARVWPAKMGWPSPTTCWPRIGYGKYSARSILARVLPADASSGVPAHGEPEKDASGGFTQRHPPRLWHAKPRPSRSRDTTTCWCIARDVVIRFAAKRLLATLPAAKEWPCTPRRVPT